MRINAGEQSEGRDTDEESADEPAAAEDRRHSECLPETRYLQRKISRETSKSLGSATDIPYALRSRATRTQSNEDTGELDNTSLQLTESTEAASVNTSEESNVNISTPRTHPYTRNLRSRTQTS
jgi:hypothetical protein